MRSIRRTLLLWLYGGLALGIIVAAIGLYYQARAEANRIFDYQMQQIAFSLPSQPFAPLAPERRSARALSEAAILIQIWDGNGVRIYNSHERFILSPLIPVGFTNVETDEGPWRVYSIAHGGLLVQVGQPLSTRRALAADTSLRTVAPLLLLFPFLGLLIWLTVGAGLAPVRRVAQEVETRDVSALEPIARQQLPIEIQPLARALNDLLARLQRALGAQRAFIADAAHEMRTPLTALQLQIELAERAHSEDERRRAFDALRQGYARAMNLVHQLLTLARHEPGAAILRQERVETVALAQDVVAEFAPLAERQKVVLSLEAIARPVVEGDPDALRILLANLVSNAIRYTPEGGAVTLSIMREGGHALLRVQDTGPGIAEADLERVFDRFYRVTGDATTGSGLGLAIAKQIAEGHGGALVLSNTAPGLRAELRLPEQSESFRGLTAPSDSGRQIA